MMNVIEIKLADLSNAVYRSAVEHFEKGEHDGTLHGNGHHMAQELCEAAVAIYKTTSDRRRAMTAEELAIIRRQLVNRGGVPCLRCFDRGRIQIRHNSRGDSWHEEDCQQCGGIAIRAVGLLTELLDELDIDRAPLYTDRIANLERERDAARAWGTNPCTDPVKE